MNTMINTQNNDILTQNQNQMNNSISNHLSKINSIVNPAAAYTYGDVITVNDVVNVTYYYDNIVNSTFNGFWLAPVQKVDVYIGVNPCASRDKSLNCIAGGTYAGNPLSSYKLGVHSGNPITGGKDSNGDGIDDVWGISSTFNDNPYIQALSYNYSVNTPSQTTYQTLGLPSTTTLYEFYPGNSSIGFKGWVIKATTITFSSDTSTALSTSQPSNMITAQINKTAIDFQATVSGSNLPDTYIAFSLLNASNNNQTVCTSVTSCYTAGFLITQTSVGSNNSDPKLTGSNGVNVITVSFTGLYSVNEGNYYLVAQATFVNPPDVNATNYGPIYSLTQNKNATSRITVLYNLQTPMIQQVNRTYPTGSFKMYPFSNSTNPRIRPGDYFEGTVHTNITYQSTNVTGAKINVQLYDALTQQNYTSQLTSPTGFATLSFPDGNNNQSDTSGNLRFRITLSSSAPLTTFNLVIIGNYVGLTNTSPYWIKTSHVRLANNYTFTVDNMYDSGRIKFVEFIPSPHVNLTTSLTTLTFVFQATAILNSTYAGYAVNYGIPLLPSVYPLYDLPVNATIALGPVNEVTLGVGQGFLPSPYSGYYYTNASGYIEFTLSTYYPNIYNLTQYKLNVIGNYVPLYTSNSTYAFTRDNTTIPNGYSDTSTVNSTVAVFDPNYQIIGIQYLGYNLTTPLSLNPGDTGYFFYQAYFTGNLTGAVGVPFNFNLLSGLNTPGITYSTTNPVDPLNSNYYLTGANGMIVITFTSTYGVAPESPSGVLMRFNVYLNISLFNSTNSGPYFYIGTNSKTSGTLNDYTVTWSNDSSGYFYLRAIYLYASPVWVTSISDSHVIDNTMGINLVRPMNETIQVRLYVKFSNGTVVKHIQLPVNVTMTSTYPGATLSYSNLTAFPLYSTGWYLTNTAGYIDFNITIWNYPGSPLTGLIRLNATVQFGDLTKLQTGYSANVYRWVVGSHYVPGYNLSQSSLETISSSANFLNVTVGPAYLFGKITAQSASSGTSTGNPLIVQPNKYVSLPFKVTITNTLYSTNDGLASIGLANIYVYLNETVLNSYNMTVVQNGKLTNSLGIVTFNISTVNSVGNTSDGLYVIPAYADFQNDMGLNPALTGSTQTFNYKWLNGTIQTIGILNNISLQSISNYSPGNSATLAVKAAQTMSVSISRVFDKNMKLVVISDPLNVTVLRGYTLEVSVSYVAANGSGLASNVDLTTIVDDPNPLNVNRTGYSLVTSLSGQGVVNITIGNNYNVGKATIIAENPNLIAGTPFFINNVTFNIESILQFQGTPTYTIDHGYNEVYLGETVTVKGVIRDELGSITNTTYNTDVLNEFINNLKVTGFDGISNVIILNSIVYGTFVVNSTMATFTVIWTVPVTFSGRNISLQVDFNKTGMAHFNNSLLPTVLLNPVLNVFQGVQFYFSLTKTNAVNTNITASTINVNVDYTGALNLTGHLLDNYNRTLTGRLVYFEIVTSSTTKYNTTTDSSGYFSIPNIIGSINQNKTYQLIMYYNITNGNTIKSLNNTVVRIIHDITPPLIIVTQGVTNGSYQYQDINFQFNITDPTKVNNNLVSATGVNKNSVQLLVNGTVYWDGAIDGGAWNGISLLNISWLYSSINTALYNTVNITLIARDNAGNMKTIVFFIKIDHIKPTITFVNPSVNDTYLYKSNYTLSFDASDAQTGLNGASAGVYIDGNFVAMSSVSATHFVSGPISFYQLPTNTTLVFTITDHAGNTYNSSILLVLTDNKKPTINLAISNLNNFNAYSLPITFTFDVADGQTGVNSTSIALYNSNKVEITSTNLQIQGSGNSYTVSGVLNRNDLDFNFSSQTFYLNVTDNNGNTNSYKLIFNIDIVAPIITNKAVYQPDLNTQVFNTTTNTQYIEFNYNDLGTPTTGVDNSSITIQLNINGTKTLLLTIQNGVLDVNDSTVAKDFTLDSFNSSSVIIKWTIKDISKYGFPKTHAKQNLFIIWEVTGLKDKFGNNVSPSPSTLLTYDMEVPALPPPPDVVGELATIGFTFGMFILIGIAIAFVYEKIRYVG